MISTDHTDWDQPIKIDQDLSLWSWVSIIYGERFFYRKKKLKSKKNHITERLTQKKSGDPKKNTARI